MFKTSIKNNLLLTTQNPLIDQEQQVLDNVMQIIKSQKIDQNEHNLTIKNDELNRTIQMYPVASKWKPYNMKHSNSARYRKMKQSNHIFKLSLDSPTAVSSNNPLAKQSNRTIPNRRQTDNLLISQPVPVNLDLSKSDIIYYFHNKLNGSLADSDSIPNALKPSHPKIYCINLARIGLTKFPKKDVHTFLVKISKVIQNMINKVSNPQ